MQPLASEDDAFTPMEQGSVELLKALHHMARPDAVFSAPVGVGDQTVIAAAEVTLGIGIAFGGGSSSGVTGDDASAGVSPKPGKGIGGGGGGGGRSRPVAVIVVGPDGVVVKPVVDITKVLLACLSLGGLVAVEIAKARRRRHG
jgi:uncharacterized spore protein YtfJ